MMMWGQGGARTGPEEQPPKHMIKNITSPQSLTRPGRPFLQNLSCEGTLSHPHTCGGRGLRNGESLAFTCLSWKEGCHATCLFT